MVWVFLAKHIIKKKTAKILTFYKPLETGLMCQNKLLMFIFLIVLIGYRVSVCSTPVNVTYPTVHWGDRHSLTRHYGPQLRVSSLTILSPLSALNYLFQILLLVAFRKKNHMAITAACNGLFLKIKAKRNPKAKQSKALAPPKRTKDQNPN